MLTNEGPPADGWGRLGLFLSRDIIERRYAERHGRTVDAGKAAEIIAHLEQGRQYFRSAETAGVLAGPLEQYYGVLAFSRAIILFRDSRAREATLKRGHGLHAELSRNGRVEDITLKICRGTFDELLTASGNRRRATVSDYTSGTTSIERCFPLTRSLQRPQIGNEFGVVDILSRMPELREDLEEALQQRAHNYPGMAFLGPNALSVTVWSGPYGLPPPEDLRLALGIGVQYTASVTPNMSVGFTAPLSAGPAPNSMIPPDCLAVIDGNSVLIEPFSGGWYLSDLCSYFAASHVMSMLVRYYPTLWGRILAHEESDRLLPVFERARSLLQNRFVRLVLWELERLDPPN